MADADRQPVTAHDGDATVTNISVSPSVWLLFVPRFTEGRRLPDLFFIYLYIFLSVVGCYGFQQTRP